jgi:hypothetical protein
MEYCNNVIKDNILFVTKHNFCEGASTDFLWGSIHWLFVREHPLTFCEGASTDFLWGSIHRLFVREHPLTFCEGASTDFLWVSIHWIFVREHPLTFCEGASTDFLWGSIHWLLKEGVGICFFLFNSFFLHCISRVLITMIFYDKLWFFPMFFLDPTVLILYAFF